MARKVNLRVEMTLEQQKPRVCVCVQVDNFGVLFMVLWQAKDIMKNLYVRLEFEYNAAYHRHTNILWWCRQTHIGLCCKQRKVWMRPADITREKSKCWRLNRGESLFDDVYTTSVLNEWKNLWNKKKIIWNFRGSNSGFTANIFLLNFSTIDGAFLNVWKPE